MFYQNKVYDNNPSIPPSELTKIIYNLNHILSNPKLSKNSNGSMQGINLY